MNYMWLFLTHKMSFNSSESPMILQERLHDHAGASKSSNWFTAPIQDYAIKLKKKPDYIRIESRHGRNSFYLKLRILEQFHGSRIETRIVPSAMTQLRLIITMMFIWIIPFPVELKVAISLLMYCLELINLGFKVWWTKDFFAKKLLLN